MDCYQADQVWNILKYWTGIGLDNLGHALDIDKIFNLKVGHIIKKQWQIFAAATLWTIWIAKNDCIFKNKRNSNANLSFVLKSTSFKWMMAYNWVPVYNHALYHIWEINHVSYLKLQILNRKDCLINAFLHKSDYVGFTDGSWFNEAKTGSHKAGI